MKKKPDNITRLLLVRLSQFGIRFTANKTKNPLTCRQARRGVILVKGLEMNSTSITPDGDFDKDLSHYHIPLPDLIAQYIIDNVDRTQAKQVYKETNMPARPNSLTPWDGQNPPIGTWRLDPVFGELEVLLELPLDQIIPGEPEDNIKFWEGYPLYVQWAKEGREAPAIRVVRHVDGHLVSCNRRRVLAAKDAGKKAILAWFSETDSRGRNPWIIRTEGTVWSTKVAGLKKMIADGYEPYPDDIELLKEFGEWK